MLLIVPVLTFVGCRQADEWPPSVSIATPTNNTSFAAGTEVMVSGVASDNKGVVSIGVLVEDVQHNQIVASGTGNVDEQGRFAIEVRMGDRYTPTGQFQVQATAYDAAGNPSSDFVDVYIQEAPVLFYKTLFTVQDGNNNQIMALDSFNQFVPVATLNSALTVLSVDNRAQNVIFGTEEGSLKVLEAAEYYDQFTIDLPAGPAPKAATAFASYNRDYYIGNTNAPYLQSFSNQGASEKDFNDVSYPPSALHVENDYIFATLISPAGNVRKLDRYDRTSGQLEQSVSLDWEATFLADLDEDHIVIAGEKDQTGVFAIYDKSTLSLVHEQLLPEAVRDMDTWEGNVFLLTAGGFQTYSMQYNVLYDISIFGNFHSLAYEPVDNLIYLGSQGEMWAYAMDGTQVRGNSGLSGKVVAIRHHHSK